MVGLHDVGFTMMRVLDLKTGIWNAESGEDAEETIPGTLVFANDR
jgi:hypothetical protein